MPRIHLTSPDEITLDMADDAFTANPTNATAATLLQVAMEYERDEQISTEELIDYVSVILDYLQGKEVSRMETE